MVENYPCFSCPVHIKYIPVQVFFRNYYYALPVFTPGVQPVPLQTITNENPAGPSIGTIPQARFLLSMLHMLSLKHGSNSLSLLLNSGLLALTQSLLKLIGECCPVSFIQAWNVSLWIYR